MAKLIMDIKNEREALWEQTKNLLERGHNEKTGLVAGDIVEQYERNVEKIKNLGKQIELLEKQEEIERMVNGDGKEDDVSPANASLAKSNYDREHKASPTASRGYSVAFWNMMRGSGNVPEVMDALSIGKDKEGGYTVPDEFERELVKGITDHNIIRGMAKVIRTQSGNRKIPVSTGIPTAAWMDEGDPVPETAQKYDQILLGAYKLGTMLKVSDEFMKETFFDVEDDLAKAFGTAIGQAEEDAFINGTGIKQPTGLLHDKDGAGIGAETVKSGEVGFDDLINLYYSLPAPYRKDAAFLCNEDVVRQLMLLKDGQGQYLWRPSMEEGKPDTILGKPIYVSSYMPELKAGNKAMLFGDFGYYCIADRSKRTFRRLDELFALSEHVGFMETHRVDGKLILKEAMKALVVKG